MRRYLYVGVFFFLAIAQAHSKEAGASICELGAYRSPANDIAALTTIPPDSPPGNRYTMLDGRRGFTSQPDSPVVCDKGVLRTNQRNGAAWRRLDLRATPLYFESRGVRLYGELLEPEPAAKKPPLVVLVHGSEKTSPIGLYYQQLFAAQGIAVFAYDKRGTGKSGGVYTQDFNLLAYDAAAALEAVRKMAPKRFARQGFWGGSQGGWVAPLAALKSHADFVEVGFGVAGTPLEQDQWQVDYQLGELGFPAAILPDVHSVTNATAEVAASDFSAHLDALVALRVRYGQTPWFSKIDGQYSGELLHGEIARAKSESPQVPWHFAQQDLLRKLRIPQLWVLAGDDSVAPSTPTVARLRALKKAGSKIDIFVFPHTDHGILRYTMDPSGERKTEGPAAGYLSLLADWTKGATASSYGDAAEIDRR
jgi:pimeloyl-ACP methyl ester carboxylesterase